MIQSIYLSCKISSMKKFAAVKKYFSLFVIACFCLTHITCQVRHEKKLTHHKRHHNHGERKYAVYRDLTKKLDFIKQELIEPQKQDQHDNNTTIHDTIAKYKNPITRTKIKSVKPFDVEEIVETDILVVHKDVIPKRHKHNSKRHRQSNVAGSKRKDILRPSSEKLINTDEEVVVVVLKNKTGDQTRALQFPINKRNPLAVKRGEIISEDSSNTDKQLTTLDQAFSFSSEDDEEANQIHSAFTKANDEFLKEVKVTSPDSAVKSSLPVVSSFVKDKPKKTSLLDVAKPSLKHEMRGQTKSHVNATKQWYQVLRQARPKLNDDNKPIMSQSPDVKDTKSYNIVVNVTKNKQGKLLEITSSKANLENESPPTTDEDKALDISNLDESSNEAVTKSKSAEPSASAPIDSDAKVDQSNAPDEDYFEFTSETGFPSSKMRNSTEGQKSLTKQFHDKKKSGTNEEENDQEIANKKFDEHHKEKTPVNGKYEHRKDGQRNVALTSKYKSEFMNRKYPPSNPHPVADNDDSKPVASYSPEKTVNSKSKSESKKPKPEHQIRPELSKSAYTGYPPAPVSNTYKYMTANSADQVSQTVAESLPSKVSIATKHVEQASQAISTNLPGKSTMTAKPVEQVSQAVSTSLPGKSTMAAKPVEQVSQAVAASLPGKSIMATKPVEQVSRAGATSMNYQNYQPYSSYSQNRAKYAKPESSEETKMTEGSQTVQSTNKNYDQQQSNTVQTSNSQNMTFKQDKIVDVKPQHGSDVSSVAAPQKSVHNAQSAVLEDRYVDALPKPWKDISSNQLVSQPRTANTSSAKDGDERSNLTQTVPNEAADKTVSNKETGGQIMNKPIKDDSQHLTPKEESKFSDETATEFVKVSKLANEEGKIGQKFENEAKKLSQHIAIEGSSVAKEVGHIDNKMKQFEEHVNKISKQIANDDVKIAQNVAAADIEATHNLINAENKTAQHIFSEGNNVEEATTGKSNAKQVDNKEMKPEGESNKFSIERTDKPVNISVEAALKTLLSVPNLSIHISKNSSLSSPPKIKKTKKKNTIKKMEHLEKIGFVKSTSKKSKPERLVDEKPKHKNTAHSIVNDDDATKRNGKVRPEDIEQHEIVKDSGIQGRVPSNQIKYSKRDSRNRKHQRRDSSSGGDILKEIINGENTFQRFAAQGGTTHVDNSMIENAETNVEANPEEVAKGIAGFGINDERYGESWFEGQNRPIGVKPLLHHHHRHHDHKVHKNQLEENLNSDVNENHFPKHSVNSLHGFEPDKEDEIKHVRDKTETNKGSADEIVRAIPFGEEKLNDFAEQKTSNIMKKICRNAECRNKDGTADVDDDDLSQYVHGGDEIVAQVSIGNEGKSLSKYTKEEHNDPKPILPELNLNGIKNGHSSFLQSLPNNVTATVEELKEVTADERDVSPHCQCKALSGIEKTPSCAEYCNVLLHENSAFSKATHEITELENLGRINAKPDNKLFHHDSMETKPITKLLEGSLLNPNPKPDVSTIQKNFLPALAKDVPVPEEKRLSPGFVRKLQIDKTVLEHVKNDIRHDPGISDALKDHLKQVADTITKAKVEKILAQPSPSKQLIGRNFHHHHHEPIELGSHESLSHLLGQHAHDRSSFSFHNSHSDESEMAPIHVDEGSNPELVANLLHRSHHHPHHHHNPMLNIDSLNSLLHQHHDSDEIEDDGDEESHGNELNMHGSSNLLNQLLHHDHGYGGGFVKEEEDDHDDGERENYHDGDHFDDDDDEKAVISKGQLMKLLHQSDEGESHHSQNTEEGDDGDDEEYVDEDNDEHMMFANHDENHSRYHHHRRLLEPEAVHFTDQVDELGVNVSSIKSTPCRNGGLFLKLRHRKPQCVCPHQYYGKTCKSWNYCFPSPCENGAQCVLIPEMPYQKCICARAYMGPTCKDFNPCDPNPCNNQGVCSHDGKTATCTCNSRFKGDNCAELNNCYPDPCKNGGVCVDSGGGKFKCNCKEGYVGNTCEGVSVCYSQNPCENGGTCVENGTSFSCVCAKGFLGNSCKDKVCAPNPCKNSGTCIQKENSAFACLCPPWATGDTCDEVSPCRMNPCKNGARCIDGMSGFRWTLKQMQYFCDCLPPFQGSHCEKNSCSDCHPNAHCEIDRCVCNHDYYGNGKACRKLNIPGKSKKKKCHPNPCKNDGICFEKHDGGIGCKCKHAYLPPMCKDRDPCKPNPCGTYGECIATGRAIKCKCSEQHSGRYCNLINPCKEVGLCANNGECVPTGNNTYGCSCMGRWSGLRCQDCSCPRSTDDSFPSAQCDVNGACKCPENFVYNVVTGQCIQQKKIPMPEVFGKSCRTNPCENGGQCIEEMGVSEEPTYKCICPESTYGRNCIYKKKCSPNPCLNGGTCLELDGRFLGCKCVDGYHTPLCGKEVMPTTACKPSPCQNGASCIPHPNGGYDCICKTRFTGPHCQIDRCRDCDENAKCEQGRCVCNEKYIGNGYECIKKTCQTPCLQFQTCVDSKCQCIPGHKEVSNICIPITDFTNGKYLEIEEEVNPLVTAPSQMLPAVKKPTTRPNIRPVAPTGKFNNSLATAPTTIPTTKVTTVATTVTSPTTRPTVIATTTLKPKNITKATIFNNTMSISKNANVSSNLLNSTSSLSVKNISSAEDARNKTKQKTDTNKENSSETKESSETTPLNTWVDANITNIVTDNVTNKEPKLLPAVTHNVTKSSHENSTWSTLKWHAKTPEHSISLAELSVGLTRLAAPEEHEKASISDGISPLDSGSPSMENNTVIVKPKKKKTKAERNFDAKMKILSSYLRTHGNAKLNKVLEDIISERKNRVKNKHGAAKKESASKKRKKEESLIIHVHTGSGSELSDLNSVLKRVTQDHELASLTPEDIERMLEKHQAKMDEKAKKKQVKHEEPLTVNVKVGDNGVKEISGVMKEKISTQQHDDDDEDKSDQATVKVIDVEDGENLSEKSEEEKGKIQNIKESEGQGQSGGLEQAQDQINEDVTSYSSQEVDDSALQNNYIGGNKKNQRPQQVGEASKKVNTEDDFNKLTADELAYYFNKKEENKNGIDDRGMTAERKQKEDAGVNSLLHAVAAEESGNVNSLLRTVAAEENAQHQVSALPSKPLLMAAPALRSAKNQTDHGKNSSSKDDIFLHQFFTKYNPAVSNAKYNPDGSSDENETKESEEDDDMTLQQLKDEQKDKKFGLNEQQQKMELETLKDAEERHKKKFREERQHQTEGNDEEKNDAKLLEELKNEKTVKDDAKKVNEIYKEERLNEINKEERLKAVRMKEKQLKILEEQKEQALKTFKEAQEKHQQLVREEELRRQDEKLREESIRYLKEKKIQALEELNKTKQQNDNIFEKDEDEEESLSGKVSEQKSDQQKLALKTLMEAQQRHEEEERAEEEKRKSVELEDQNKKMFEEEKKMAFKELKEQQKLQKEKKLKEEERRRKEEEKRNEKEKRVEEEKRRKEEEQRKDDEEKRKEGERRREEEREMKLKKLQKKKEALKALEEAQLREKKKKLEEEDHKKEVLKKLEKIRLLHEQKRKERKAFEEAKLKEKERNRQEEEEKQKINIRILKEEREKSLKALKNVKLRQKNAEIVDQRKEEYEMQKEENRKMLDEQRTQALQALKNARDRQLETQHLEEIERHKQIEKSLEEQKRLALTEQKRKKQRKLREEEQKSKAENMKLLTQLKIKKLEILAEKEKQDQLEKQSNATEKNFRESKMIEKIKQAAHEENATQQHGDQESENMLAEIKEESMKVLSEENNEQNVKEQQHQRNLPEIPKKANRTGKAGKSLQIVNKEDQEVDEDEEKEDESMEEQKQQNEKLIQELKQEATQQRKEHATSKVQKDEEKAQNYLNKLKEEMLEGNLKKKKTEENAGKAMQQLKQQALDAFRDKQKKWKDALLTNTLAEKRKPLAEEENKKVEEPQLQTDFQQRQVQLLKALEQQKQGNAKIILDLQQKALETFHNKQKQWRAILSAKTKEEEKQSTVDEDENGLFEKQNRKRKFKQKSPELNSELVKGDGKVAQEGKWKNILSGKEREVQRKGEKVNTTVEKQDTKFANEEEEEDEEDRTDKNPETGEKIDNKKSHDLDRDIKMLKEQKLKEKMKKKEEEEIVSKVQNATSIMENIKQHQIKELQEREKKLEEKYLEEEKKRKVQEIHEKQKLLNEKIMQKIQQQEYTASQNMKKLKKQQVLKKFLNENADTDLLEDGLNNGGELENLKSNKLGLTTTLESSGHHSSSKKQSKDPNLPANNELVQALLSLNKIKSENEKSSSQPDTSYKCKTKKTESKFQSYVESLLHHRQQGISHEVAFRRSKEINYDNDYRHGLAFKRSQTARVKKNSERRRTRNKKT